MAITTNLRGNFNSFVNTYGKKYIVYFRSSSYDDYDQATLSVTGSSTGSLITMPISESRNGEDYQYLQQGLVKVTDLKVFMPSGQVAESDLVCVSSGSYTVLRVFPWDTEGNTIYTKLYIRSSGGYNP